MSPVRIAALLSLSILSACAGAVAPSAGAPAYPFNVAGGYTGRFIIDGQPFESTLQLRTAGDGSVTGGFRVTNPIEIDGRVQGRIVDDLLRFTATYRSLNDCDDRIEGIVTIASGGGTVSGPITVTTCDEQIAGRMSFQRRAR
jgi:hypothetical protein